MIVEQMLNNAQTPLLHIADVSGSASIVENANAGMAALVDGTDIPVVTLDSMNLSGVSFIKIDAEGWECDVLDGARETIARCRPTMLIEVNESALKGRGRSRALLIVKIEGMRYSLRNVYPGQKMTGPQYDALCHPLVYAKANASPKQSHDHE